MARRRPLAAVDGTGPDLVLPAHLVQRRRLPMTAGAFAEFRRERDDWFRAHGVDPLDWGSVSPVLRASDAAHGVESTPRRRLRLRAAEYDGTDRDRG